MAIAINQNKNPRNNPYIWFIVWATIILAILGIVLVV